MRRATPILALVAVSGLAACANPSSSAAPQATATAVPASPTPTIPPASAESLTITFTSSSPRLSPEALKQLDGAARLYRDAQPEVMIVTGHADSKGAELQNVILSAHRADAVKRALVDRGVPTERLQIVADGMAEPVPGVTPGRDVVVTWR